MCKSPNRNSVLLADLEDALKSNRLTMPSLPDVALQMRKVLDSPKSTSLQVVRTVGKDPAIAARLMKVANSALYRAKHPIEDIHTAVTRLGIVRVRYLVNSLAVLQVLKPLKGAADRLMRRLSAHSIQVAATCHALALRCRTIDPHQAMLAGLIHDIGYLPLLQKAAEMPELSHDEGLLRRMLHQLHTTAGAAVLRSWSFPCELIDVVLEHENVYRKGRPQPDLVDITIIANLRQQATRIGPAPLKTDELQVPAFAKLGIDWTPHAPQAEAMAAEDIHALL